MEGACLLEEAGAKGERQTSYTKKRKTNENFRRGPFGTSMYS